MFLQLMCLRSIFSVSGVLYIPFIHSRHNTQDRSLGQGRDIIANVKWKQKQSATSPYFQPLPSADSSSCAEVNDITMYAVP